MELSNARFWRSVRVARRLDDGYGMSREMETSAQFVGSGRGHDWDFWDRDEHGQWVM